MDGVNQLVELQESAVVLVHLFKFNLQRVNIFVAQMLHKHIHCGLFQGRLASILLKVLHYFLIELCLFFLTELLLQILGLSDPDVLNCLESSYSFVGVYANHAFEKALALSTQEGGHLKFSYLDLFKNFILGFSIEGHLSGQQLVHAYSQAPDIAFFAVLAS